MGICAGIDLGTTYSSLAVLNESGMPELVKNTEGESLTPSVVYFGSDEVLVGKIAKEYQAFGEEDAASFFKRSMGDSNWLFFTDDKSYTPTDLSAMVLSKLKADAEQTLGQEISHVVITVPAYFSDLQRKNTIEAGKKANLKVMRIINEPTAAAISYGVESFHDNATILVYDLGGGTFDVSLVSVSNESIKVVVTDGDHELGGKDWDDALLNYLCGEFEAEHGIDPYSDSILLNDFFVKAESVKKALSSMESTAVMLAYQGKRSRIVITREKFEQLTSHLMEKTINLLNHVISDANIQLSDITGILCVGGSTRMPMVQRFLKDRLERPLLTGVNVDEAVALGAAIQAAVDMKDHSTMYLPAGREMRSFLAAPKRIEDITSHSLGMVAINEDRSRYINSIIIPKNTSIPSKETHPYQFVSGPGSTNEMEVYITQGESKRPLDCTILGKYRFIDIPTDNEKAVLDISYSYDANGVVQIDAVERASKKAMTPVVDEVEDDLSWMDEPPAIHTYAHEHVTLYIAIDLSGSMSGNPLEEAKKAAQNLVSNMDITHSSIGVIGVADKVKTVQEACQDVKRISKAIDSLSINLVGYGNAADPFDEVYHLLKNQSGLKFVLVLADGIWNNQSVAIKRAKKCHDSDIEVIAIGFGGADKKFLKDIASSDESALFTDLGSLVKTFDRVAQVLTEQTGSSKRDKLRIF